MFDKGILHMISSKTVSRSEKVKKKRKLPIMARLDRGGKNYYVCNY